MHFYNPLALTVKTADLFCKRVVAASTCLCVSVCALVYGREGGGGVVILVSAYPWGDPVKAPGPSISAAASALAYWI